ncbi:conserved protein of unknown function [Tenacibaculum soleae]|uniref:protease complex subunit PrcB family protein n=1 Tax=Tenacibaculum soleae TaxID=447689 RepID=UPI003AB576E8
MKLFFTLFFSILMSSCPSNQKKSEITSLYKGSLAGDGSEGFIKENLVINSVDKWKEFLTKIDDTNTISTEFKNSVDFSKNTILVAIDAKKTTGGFSVEILNKIQNNDKLQVTVLSKGPKPTDMVTMSLTQPIHIVKINKTNKEIIFVNK